MYRERTGWPWWVNLLVAGTTGGAILGPLVDRSASSMDPLTRTLIVAGIAVFVVLLYLFLGGLTVVVESDRIRVGLGLGWPVRTTIVPSEIESVESVEYRPLRDFGGWGVRGTRQRRIWSARGIRAVRLGLADGRVFYIGSDEPRTLENRIRQVMPA